jgi:nucleoside-diphosphate-sugar epimerase
MTSLVTGASGFVGQAIVRRLLADGDGVRALTLPGDRRLPELRALGAPERLEVVEADVTSYAAVAPHCAGVARVVHTAALVHGWHPWERYRAVNVGGTQHVARAAAAHGVTRFVHVSTSDVFGIPRGEELIDESTPYREWGEPYPDTKIAAERWLWQFHRESGLPVSVIYPCWVYGPGDQASFPSLRAAIDDGFMVFWHRHTRLFWSYIDNLADAVLLAATHPAAVGNGYLVHDGEDGPTLQEVCARIAAQAGRPAPTRHLPYGVAFGAAWLAQAVWRVLRLRGAPVLLTNDVKSFGLQWRISNAKLRRELGWAPRVGIADGMAAALEYLGRTLLRRSA